MSGSKQIELSPSRHDALTHAPFLFCIGEIHHAAMSSNTSQRKAQAIILASTVSAFRTWSLIAECGGCGPRAVPMVSLPAGEIVFNVVMRLCCRTCGARAAYVALDNAEQGWRRRVVKAWGPGSYG